MGKHPVAYVETADTSPPCLLEIHIYEPTIRKNLKLLSFFPLKKIQKKKSTRQKMEN